MVSEVDVMYAYRFILGREPESPESVKGFAKAATWEELRGFFLQSDEFRNKATAAVPGRESTPPFIMSPPNPVDVEVADADFARLIGHVQRTWEELGSEKPHWSVLTSPDYMPDQIEANKAAFYESGAGSLAILEAAAARAGRTLAPGSRIFELGCGVGRVTQHLARRFASVVAADISQPHLDIARQHMDQAGIRNVRFVRVEQLASIEAVEPFDGFYSVIVLQHNPPPLIDRLLRIILGKIRPGGFVYFQVPVASPGYAFSIRSYLETMDRGARGMEMHCLPQAKLFGLLDQCGLKLLDVQRDNWAGADYHSLTVFAEKA